MRLPGVDLLRIAARVAAKKKPGPAKVYLGFTSASGAAVWEVAGGDASSLKPLVDAYNETAAWQARGGDGTAYVGADPMRLLKDMGYSPEPGEGPEDVVESYGQVDSQQAQDMLTGKTDALIGP